MNERGENFDETGNGNSERLADAFLAAEGQPEAPLFHMYKMPEKILVNGQEFSTDEVFSASPFASPEFAALSAEDQDAVAEIVKDAGVIREVADGGVRAAQVAALGNEFFAAETPGDQSDGRAQKEKETLVSHAIAWMSKFGRQLTVAGLVGVAAMAPMKNADAQNYGVEVTAITAEANAQRAQIKVRAAQVKENFKKISNPTETQIAQYEADLARVNADFARINAQEKRAGGQGVYEARQRDAQGMYIEGQQRIQRTEIAGQIEQLKAEKIQQLMSLDAQIRQLRINRLQVINQSSQPIQQIFGGGMLGSVWQQGAGVALHGLQDIAQINAQIDNLQLEKTRIATVFDTRISSLKAQLPQQPPPQR